MPESRIAYPQISPAGDRAGSLWTLGGRLGQRGRAFCSDHPHLGKTHSWIRGPMSWATPSIRRDASPRPEKFNGLILSRDKTQCAVAATAP